MGLLRNGKSLCLQDTFQQPPGRKKAHCAAFTFPCQIPCYYFRKAQLQAHNFHRFFEKCPIDYVLQTAQKRNSRINGRLTQSILVCSQNLSVTVSMWTPWLQDTLSVFQKDGGTWPIHFSLSNISFIIEYVCKLTSLSSASTTATITIFVFHLPAKFALPLLQHGGDVHGSMHLMNEHNQLEDVSAGR